MHRKIRRHFHSKPAILAHLSQTLVFLLEDCSFIHIFKKSLKHNHYWAKINMSHQQDVDVKSLDLVLDRI